ncbi:InlB B-repeat-containing protein [Fodinibius salinus]|nr:hypothetical protein [Fodinibius salinus]
MSVMIMGCGGSSTGGDDKSSEQVRLLVTENPSEGGSVDPARGTFDVGEEVTVKADANDGYGFGEWTGDQQSQDNPLTFTINEQTNLTANFVQTGPRYSMVITAGDGTETINDLETGQSYDATASFDENLDKDAPPSPPQGAFDARFVTQSDNLRKDYRSSTVQQVDWTLKYQLSSGQDLNLSWNLSVQDQSLDGDDLILTDQSGSFEKDMTNSSSYTVSGASSGTLIISYTAN